MPSTKRIARLDTGPKSASLRLILAHGAGAGMTSPFLEAIAALLADRGVAVTRFEFGYMAERRDGGKRRPPPKAESLMGEYRQFLDSLAKGGKGATTLIGGKSMGGRIASMITDEALESGLAAGLVCLGYPFHPPGKPESLRTAHLENLKCPALIVQGERDPFGAKEEVERLKLSRAIEIVWAPDGDHDLRPRAASGFTRAGNLAAAADAIAAFAARLR